MEGVINYKMNEWRRVKLPGEKVEIKMEYCGFDSTLLLNDPTMWGMK